MIGREDFIIDLLIARGIISDEQLQEAKKRYQEDELRNVLEALYLSRAVSEADVLQLLAAEYGMDVYDFDQTKEHIPEQIISMIPGEIAKRYHMVPIAFAGGILRVATADPADIESLDAVRHLTKMDVEGVIASNRQIERALDFYYGRQDATGLMEELTQTTMDVTISGTTTDATLDQEGGEEDDEQAPIIRYVSLLILEAFRSRASDIHLEPLEKKFRVRYRIDGVLNEVESPPKYLQKRI